MQENSGICVVPKSAGLLTNSRKNSGIMFGGPCKTPWLCGLAHAVPWAFQFLLLSSVAVAQNNSGPEVTIKYFDLSKGRLAFVYEKDKKSDIWVLDFGTLTVLPLVNTPGPDSAPSWSPDGQVLAFDCEVSGDREIYTVNADGSHLTRLTNSPGLDRDPDWSPDGSQIVFASSRMGEGTDLFVMGSNGASPQPLGIVKRKSSVQNAMPKWSPRGTEILFSTNEDWPGWDISLYDFGEKKNTLLTTGYRSFSRGSWHPSGSSFIFSYGFENEIDILEFRKGAKALVPVVSRPGKDLDAVWSDDGTKIFFAGELEPGKGNYQLFLWDSAKDSIEQVASAAGIIHHPTWTPLSIRPAAIKEPSPAPTKTADKKKGEL
jgi:Tol biopolymer transport system component